MKQQMNLYSKSIGLSISYFENNKIEESKLSDENGLMISRYKYYKNGQLADSVFYDETENIDSAFHYYENGNIKAIYHFDYNTKIESLAAYSASGKEIKNIHYLAKARYKTGDDDWKNFIKQNLNALAAVENKAPEGTYTVVVKFDIERDGSLSNIRAETNHKYGMEDAVIKMIKKSQKWTPEIFLGEPRLVNKRQLVTFVVTESY